jgi:hypothetical protein
MMIRLNLIENGYHSLYHAVEHLEMAESFGVWENDKDWNGFVTRAEWKNGKKYSVSYQGGTLFTKPPHSYHYKFAILHLIQALELIIKGYIHQNNPDDVFRDKVKGYTITLQQALDKLTVLEPLLLSLNQINLIKQAKDIRNSIEHYMFSLKLKEARTICLDFLALCNYLTYRFFNVSLIEEWSYDPWNNDSDPIAETLRCLLAEVSSIGKESNSEIAKFWFSQNLDDTVYVCINCGAPSASVAKGCCVVCGEEIDEEIYSMMNELETNLTHLNNLHNIYIQLQKKGIKLPHEAEQFLHGEVTSDED